MYIYIYKYIMFTHIYIYILIYIYVYMYVYIFMCQYHARANLSLCWPRFMKRIYSELHFFKWAVEALPFLKLVYPGFLRPRLLKGIDQCLPNASLPCPDADFGIAAEYLNAPSGDSENAGEPKLFIQAVDHFCIETHGDLGHTHFS